MFTIDNVNFELVEERGEAYNEEAIENRWSDILNRYDYVLGDWGYGQLRLKGFFIDENNKAVYDNKVSTIREYIHEFCNFGCPYFILKKVD